MIFRVSEVLRKAVDGSDGRFDGLLKTYELLKRDPTPSLQRKLNSKIFSMRKANMINLLPTQMFSSTTILYGLPKLHEPQIPMRPIVSFCGSPTYELSKHLTTVLQPLTNKSQHKVQSTENFIDAIKTVQIPDDYKLVSFDVKSLFTNIPLQLTLDRTKTVIDRSTDELPLPTDDTWKY